MAGGMSESVGSASFGSRNGDSALGGAGKTDASGGTTGVTAGGTVGVTVGGEIEVEATVETLIKAKGFDECVAVISNNIATVVVGTDDTLTPSHLAQIKEILYEQAGVLPVNVRVSEKALS